MTEREQIARIIERLRATRKVYNGRGTFRDEHVNPDGPKIADELEAIIALRPTLQDGNQIADAAIFMNFVGRWVERGLFDRDVAAGDALSVIANYPAMPFNRGRWDVDHKPYAAEFYRAHPKAAPRDGPVGTPTKGEYP